MFFQRNSNEIAWWELRRILFNILMLVSGVVLLTGVQILKPIHSSYFSGYYFDLILFYALIANVIYTAIYFYIISLVEKFVSSEQHVKVKKYTLNCILIGGIVMNVIVALCELYYRTYR